MVAGLGSLGRWHLSTFASCVVSKDGLLSMPCFSIFSTRGRGPPWTRPVAGPWPLFGRPCLGWRATPPDAIIVRGWPCWPLLFDSHHPESRASRPFRHVQRRPLRSAYVGLCKGPPRTSHVICQESVASRPRPLYAAHSRRPGALARPTFAFLFPPIVGRHEPEKPRGEKRPALARNKSRSADGRLAMSSTVTLGPMHVAPASAMPDRLMGRSTVPRPWTTTT